MGQYDNIVFLPISDALEGQDFDVRIYDRRCRVDVDGETNPLTLVGWRQPGVPVVRVSPGRAFRPGDRVRAGGVRMAAPVARGPLSAAQTATGRSTCPDTRTFHQLPQRRIQSKSWRVETRHDCRSGIRHGCRHDTSSVAWAVFGQTPTVNLPPVVAGDFRYHNTGRANRWRLSSMRKTRMATSLAFEGAQAFRPGRSWFENRTSPGHPASIKATGLTRFNSLSVTAYQSGAHRGERITGDECRPSTPEIRETDPARRRRVWRAREKHIRFSVKAQDPDGDVLEFRMVR